MSEQEILKASKLIAEFIAYKKYDSQHGSEKGKPIFVDYYNIKEVPLNCDDMDWHSAVSAINKWNKENPEILKSEDI